MKITQQKACFNIERFEKRKKSLYFLYFKFKSPATFIFRVIR